MRQDQGKILLLVEAHSSFRQWALGLLRKVNPLLISKNP